jgi:hypothetical protein
LHLKLQIEVSNKIWHFGMFLEIKTFGVIPVPDETDGRRVTGV